MSSTETTTTNNNKNKNRAKFALISCIVAAACMSSMTYSPEAEAQELQVTQTEPLAADASVAAVVVGGALAAYGWLADKVYDLGKEVGKWAAGSTTPAPSETQMLGSADADYLLN